MFYLVNWGFLVDWINIGLALASYARLLGRHEGAIGRSHFEAGEEGLGFFGEPGFGVEGDGLLGESAGGGGVVLVGGEEGQVVAGDAAVGGGVALVVTSAEVGFGFGVLGAFGEEGAEGAVEGGHARGEFEGSADAEFRVVVEFRLFVDDGDAGELVEEGDPRGVGDEGLKSGGAFGLEAAVVLEHDGGKFFGQDDAIEFRLIWKGRLSGGNLCEESVETRFGGSWLV